MRWEQEQYNLTQLNVNGRKLFVRNFHLMKLFKFKKVIYNKNIKAVQK
jgi:hypothetical protein